MGGKNGGNEKEQLLEKLNRICFREIIGIQNKIEADKNTLAEQADFTVEGAFSLFSASPIQKLTPSDIEIAMQNLGLSCTTRDARLIVARYDTDSDSRIGFWEFANIFLPIDVQARTRLETRPTLANKEISKETTRMIKRVLGSIVDAENMVEEIRRRVKQLTESLRGIFD